MFISRSNKKAKSLCPFFVENKNKIDNECLNLAKINLSDKSIIKWD